MNNSHSLKTITKLNRLTKDDEIKWNRISVKPTSLNGSEEITGYVYGTSVLDKLMIIYKYRYKTYNYDGDMEYVTDYRLDLVNKNYGTEWSFPNDNSLYDLYEAIQYKSSNVEQFFNDFLSGEEEKEDNASW